MRYLAQRYADWLRLQNGLGCTLQQTEWLVGVWDMGLFLFSVFFMFVLWLSNLASFPLANDVQTHCQLQLVPLFH